MQPPRMFRGGGARIVADRRALEEACLGAKQLACPHCARTGMVIGHGLLFGYAEHDSERVVRGRRLLCSKRHLRTGCGRTFSVLLSCVIAGFSVRTRTLSRMLTAVIGSVCRKVAWERAGTPRGLSLRSGYRLWRRLLAAQSHLRTTLSSTCPPPASSDPRPLAQLLEHLHCALGTTECVLSNFQLAFQCQLLG